MHGHACTHSLLDYGANRGWLNQTCLRSELVEDFSGSGGVMTAVESSAPILTGSGLPGVKCLGSKRGA